MSDFDTAVSDMTTDLLAVAGGSFVYFRGTSSTTITLRKSVQPSYQVETTTGSIVEVRPVDFIGLTADMPYTPPERGDRITGGGETFEVQPTTSEKVFRKITSTMTRIHAKQIG